MDDKLLTSLGLNVKEIKIFLAVLGARELSPVELARATDIKRTTCYSIARGLVEKGFLVEHMAKRPRTFYIAQVSDIERKLQDERKHLAKREELLRRLSSELSRAIAKESYPVPSIRFVPEEKLDQFILNQNLVVWDKSMSESDSTFWGFQDHTYVENFSDVIAKYWKRAPKEISLKMLTNQSVGETEKKMKWKYPRRQMKFWARATNFLSGIWIMGEYVVMLNTRKHPFYLVEIHDATLANDLREIFKNLWPLV